MGSFASCTPGIPSSPAPRRSGRRSSPILFADNNLYWILPIGIGFGSVGFGVIIRLPIYFQKHYGQRISAIRAHAKGLLSDKINLIVERRTELRRAIAANSSPEYPDAVEDLRYFQDETVEVINNQIADCEGRVPHVSEVIRRMGGGLVVLAPLFILSASYLLDPPWGSQFYADLTMIPVAVVATFTLLEFRTLVSIISKTEIEFNAIPSEKRPEW